MPVNELRARLRDSVSDVISLSADLEAIIAVRSRVSGSHHGKVSHSQPPWCSPVADAVLDLHAEVRQLERGIRSELGLPLRPRGGSDANTQEALKAISNLVAAADDHLAGLALRKLEGWVRRASIVLDKIDAPRRLPRLPGQPEPLCPACDRRTLRILPMEGIVRCIDVSCLRNGVRPEARMTWSPLLGDFILIWENGIAA